MQHIKSLLSNGYEELNADEDNFCDEDLEYLCSQETHCIYKLNLGKHHVKQTSTGSLPLAWHTFQRPIGTASLL
jgi:hypothetical protein